MQAGRLIKRVQIYSEAAPGGMQRNLLRVLYALPGQEWRIDAFLLLWKTASKSGWNDGFERMEGSLGYAERHNGVHIEQLWRRRTR